MPPRDNYKYKKVARDDGEIAEAEPVPARRKLSQVVAILLPMFLVLLVLSAWRGYVYHHGVIDNC